MNTDDETFEIARLSHGTSIAWRRGMRPHFSIVVSLAVLLAACGGPPNPPRAPTSEPQRPGATTSDGRVVGADGVPPTQKLEEGPKLDSRDGLKPAGSPPRE